ncbi:MAG: TIGR04372 family glycosyltransferase [Candidatus Omnitrophota bacterium]|nr:TIGR04372 family glycosyltransferase [Candidatus Omnitrophota bacterium]
MLFSERRERFVRFVRRQPRDIWEGGWPVLIRKLLMTLDVALAVPFVLAARLLRPLVLIQFGGLPMQGIGHLASDMELLLCRRDAGFYGRTLHLFCVGMPVCNQQLTRMWQRTVHVSRFARAAERVNGWLPGGWRNRIPFGLATSDVDGLLAMTTPQLSFIPEEQRRGTDALRRLGVPEGQPFVCFHARDSAYYVEKSRRKDLYRNSDIETYRPAVEALAQRGYVLFRMGAAVERRLVTHNPRIIDYASIARTDFLDIFLPAHCRFYFGDGGGLYNVALIFRRPIAIVNYISFEYSGSWNPYDCFIPKKMWLRSEHRLMTFREILESGAGRFLRDHQYAEMGIELINNTPEEITALALEMDGRLSGTWQGTAEDEALQRRFWEIFRTCTTLYASAPWRVHRRIGAEFLRQHQALLEQRTTPQPTMVWQS